MISLTHSYTKNHLRSWHDTNHCSLVPISIWHYHKSHAEILRSGVPYLIVCYNHRCHVRKLSAKIMGGHVNGWDTLHISFIFLSFFWFFTESVRIISMSVPSFRVLIITPFISLHKRYILLDQRTTSCFVTLLSWSFYFNNTKMIIDEM